MRQVFVFDGIAVIVGPWHEPMTPPERGARVEVRLLADEPEARLAVRGRAGRRSTSRCSAPISSIRWTSRPATSPPRTSTPASKASSRATGSGTRRSRTTRPRGWPVSPRPATRLLETGGRRHRRGAVARPGRRKHCTRRDPERRRRGRSHVGRRARRGGLMIKELDGLPAGVIGFGTDGQAPGRGLPRRPAPRDRASRDRRRRPRRHRHPRLRRHVGRCALGGPQDGDRAPPDVEAHRARHRRRLDDAPDRRCSGG